MWLFLKNERSSEVTPGPIRILRPELPRKLKQGLFVQVVALVVVVDTTDDRIVLDERCHCINLIDSRPRRDGKAWIDRVAVVTGVAQAVTGCDSGGVGGCEGGKDGVAVAKVDAGGAKSKECRHVCFVDRATPQTVRDEDDYIVLLLGCR